MTKKNGLFARVFTILIFLFLYVPIFVLIVFSFNNSKSRTVWSGFTTQWYVDLFNDSMIINSLYVTLWVSFLASLIATVIGTAAAIGFYSMKRRYRQTAMLVNNIPVTNPDIITGVSLMLLFVSISSVTGYRMGFGSLLLAHITFNIPYVILSVMPKLRQLNKHVYEAAIDLGAKPLYAFWHVVLPEIMPGVINGAMIAFTMSIDDFVISYFTSGSSASAQTLAMTIYSMTRKRVSPKINALSTLLFLTVLILLIIINLRQASQQKAEESKNRSIRSSRSNS